jgi:hypothetical protein
MPEPRWVKYKVGRKSGLKELGRSPKKRKRVKKTLKSRKKAYKRGGRLRPKRRKTR